MPTICTSRLASSCACNRPNFSFTVLTDNRKSPVVYGTGDSTEDTEIINKN